tara:strand:+ start:253 stop:660 length:408 start_codon:yes stop_codon:yes gene_type:complete
MPYHTRSHGPDLKALQQGLIKAIALAKTANRDIIYLAPAFANVTNSQLVDILGRARTEQFLKKREIMIEGVKFHLETKLKKKAVGPAIVIAVHVSLAQLATMMADHRTEDFVYVLWSDKELAEYEIDNPASVPIS